MKFVWNKWKIKIKDFFINLIFRLKPRLAFRWLLTFILWLILFAYLGFGVYFAVQIYGRHSDSAKVVFSTKVYPFPAAFVGGNIIWAKDYYRQLDYIKQFSESTKQAVPEASVLRQQIMDQLVENRLLSWEASKGGIRVSSKDVEAAYQKIVAESGGQSNVQKVLR